MRSPPARGARPPLPAALLPARPPPFCPSACAPASGGRSVAVPQPRSLPPQVPAPRLSRSEGRPRRWPAFPRGSTRSSSVRGGRDGPSWPGWGGTGRGAGGPPGSQPGTGRPRSWRGRGLPGAAGGRPLAPARGAAEAPVPVRGRLLGPRDWP